MREAVRGFVEARAGSGAYVVDRKDALPGENEELDIGAFELIEARLLFEGEACALAANHFRRGIGGTRKHPSDHGGRKMKREHADRRFHVTLEAERGVRAVVSQVWYFFDRRGVTFKKGSSKGLFRGPCGRIAALSERRQHGSENFQAWSTA